MSRQKLMIAALLLALSVPGFSTAAGEDTSARTRALSGLDSDQPGTRRESYAVLGAVGIDADLPLLFAALYDADRVVRGIAQSSIWQIWSRSGDAAVDRRYAIAMEQMETGKLRPAVRTLTRIIEIKPAFTEAWNKRATVYFLLGEDDQSIADCDEVLKRNPYHFGALAGYGQLMLRKRDLRRALEYFERALTVNPNMRGVEASIDMLKQALAREGRNSI